MGRFYLIFQMYVLYVCLPCPMYVLCVCLSCPMYVGGCSLKKNIYVILKTVY